MRAEEGEEVDLENALAGLILCVCTYYRGDCCTTSSKPWCFALFTICINPHVSSRHAGLSFFSVFPVSWRSQPCKGVGTEETERGNRVCQRNFQRIARSGYEARGFFSESVFVAGPSGLLSLVRYSCRNRGTASCSQSWDLNPRLLILCVEGNFLKQRFHLLSTIA